MAFGRVADVAVLNGEGDGSVWGAGAGYGENAVGKGGGEEGESCEECGCSEELHFVGGVVFVWRLR